MAREIQTYSNRANAARAARLAIKKVFGDAYEAFEGVDYIIHPKGRCGGLRERFGFQLISVVEG